MCRRGYWLSCARPSCHCCGVKAALCSVMTVTSRRVEGLRHCSKPPSTVKWISGRNELDSAGSWSAGSGLIASSTVAVLWLLDLLRWVSVTKMVRV